MAAVSHVDWPSVREYRDVAQELLDIGGLTEPERAACQKRVDNMNSMIEAHAAKDASNYTRDQLMDAWDNMWPAGGNTPGHANAAARGSGVTAPDNVSRDGVTRI